MTHDKICTLLEELRFKGMADILEDVLKKAEMDGISIRDTLYELLAAELRYRRERSLIYRMKQAGIPWEWTLSSFPFDRQPAVEKSRIMALADCRFVQRGDNIVFIGDTGTGKSGLASGLLREAILSGSRGLFYNVQDLLDDLYASLADRTTSKLLKKICRYDLLVLDELGYLTLTPEQMNAFFKLMAERYQAGKSTIVTTNLDYDKWYGLFKPKDLVDALLDRLRHHCVTIRIKGNSLRLS